MTTWQEMEALLDRLERVGDPAAREDARALVAVLMRLHGEGLTRLVDLTHQAGQGALLDVWKGDVLVNGLLLMHGLHPEELASRVQRALAEVAPSAASLGAELSVLRVSEDEVRLRLAGPPEALGRLRERAEAAILLLAPEVQSIHVEEEEDGLPSRRFSLPVLLRAGGGGAAL